MSEREKSTAEVVSMLVKSMVLAKNHAYATGYLESLLADTLDRYVKDETELTMIHIRLLGSAINFQLEMKRAA